MTDFAKNKAWGGGKTLPKRLRYWADGVRALGIGDGPLAQIADDMLEAAERLAWYEHHVRSLARSNVALRKQTGSK